LAALVAAGTLVLGTGVAQAAGQDPTGPVQPTVITAALYSIGAPTVAPPGANNWDCRPSAQHPDPVLLSNATTTNAYEDWANLSQQLADAGYCVFAGNFGGAAGSPLQTVGPIATTAKQLAAFGDRILAATGAAKLDVVGHSQGGMDVRYWIKYLGGNKKIGKVVGLAPSNYGTDLYGLMKVVQVLAPGQGLTVPACPACTEQEVGSPFLADLNAGGDTVAGVDYTVIETRYDDVVTPYTSAFLKPASNVKNIVLQDVCPLDLSDHIGLTYDPIAERLVLNALDPATAQAPFCVPVPPIVA
jgi:triacylglycerol esterase/lipase EstA (alpha/beta hydrolase family)